MTPKTHVKTKILIVTLLLGQVRLYSQWFHIETASRSTTGIAVTGQLGHSTGMDRIGHVAADGSNVIMTGKRVVRANTDPGSPNGDQMFGLTVGPYHFPTRTTGTSYIFFGGANPDGGFFKLYRAEASTINGVQTYSVTAKVTS